VIQMSQERMHPETLLLLGMWLWLDASCIFSLVSGVPALGDTSDTFSCTFCTHFSHPSWCMLLLLQSHLLGAGPHKGCGMGTPPVTPCPWRDTVCGAARVRLPHSPVHPHALTLHPQQGGNGLAALNYCKRAGEGLVVHVTVFVPLIAS